MVKGQNRSGQRSVNTRGSENIISNGSVVTVADGQAMAIVEQGRVVEFTAEPGEFVFDTSAEPSIFAGSLGKNVIDSFKTLGRRITFGGDTGRDQRVYYFNIREITGIKYGTPSPIPFRVVDNNIGLDMDISIRCHGKYSVRLVDPLLFYTNVGGNVADVYRLADLEGQMRSELLTQLQPAFAQIGAKGVRISEVPAHAAEIAEALNGLLSDTWGDLRGMRIATFNIKSVTPTPEDAELIRELQRKAVLRDPSMAGAAMVGAQADALRAAAANEGGGGAFMPIMGMNALMNSAASSNAGQFFDMAQQQQQQQAAAQATEPGGWTCQCGATATGRFCANCGQPQPAPAASWTCQCGHANVGRFCSNCGQPQPEAEAEWACQCGHTNTGRFCADCGNPKPA
jgi:membrane protease subunit (stomatin/prohibitin family)